MESPCLTCTLGAFLDHAGIDLVQVAIGVGDEPLYASAVASLGDGRLLAPIHGGTTRQVSVRNGLRALVPYAPDRVLIHDAARPFVTPDVIDRVLAALGGSSGVVAAVPVTDTLKQAGPDNRIATTLERAGLWRAQTPQGFHFARILAAHEAATPPPRRHDRRRRSCRMGGPHVMLVMVARQPQAHHREDLAMANRAAGYPDVRAGQGFDVHRLVAGDHVWLCGVESPHTHALEGHSDADVALHALTDALLGAIGAGDIGQHFPDTDPRWKGAASLIFLREALRLVRARGGSSATSTSRCSARPPRSPRTATPCAGASPRSWSIDQSRVGVKATTTEGLGFTGRREGIAALAAATVIMG